MYNPNPQFIPTGRYSITGAAKEFGVARETMSRWANGYTDHRGVYHAPILKLHFTKFTNKKFIVGADLIKIYRAEL